MWWLNFGRSWFWCSDRWCYARVAWHRLWTPLVIVTPRPAYRRFLAEHLRSLTSKQDVIGAIETPQGFGRLRDVIAGAWDFLRGHPALPKIDDPF